MFSRRRFSRQNHYSLKSLVGKKLVRKKIKSVKIKSEKGLVDRKFNP